MPTTYGSELLQLDETPFWLSFLPDRIPDELVQVDWRTTLPPVLPLVREGAEAAVGGTQVDVILGNTDIIELRAECGGS